MQVSDITRGSSVCAEHGYKPKAMADDHKVQHPMYSRFGRAWELFWLVMPLLEHALSTSPLRPGTDSDSGRVGCSSGRRRV